MWKRFGKLYLSSLVGLTLLLGALPASADATLGQPVTHINFNTAYGPNGELDVVLPSGHFYADPGGYAGCNIPVPSADTVKIWLGLAQAALLSGKSVDIGYTDCSGYHWIVSFTLKR